MKPLRFWLKDFMSHKYTDIDCTQFQSALIVAKNRNNPRISNGEGKTTIFKALEYVLFGVTSVNLEKIIRHGATECEVGFEFETQGKTYKVVRNRGKKSEVYLFEKAGDQWLSLTQKTPSQTDTELKKIVKISHSAFKSSILFAQADLYGLASVSPKDRKALLKEPLQISIYNKYEKVAKEKTSLASKNVDKTKALIQYIGEPQLEIDSLNLKIKETEENLTALDITKTGKLSELGVKKANLEELVGQKGIDPDSIRKELNEIKSQKSSVLSKLNNVKSNISSDESKLLQNKHTAKTASENIAKYEKELQDLNNANLRTSEDIKKDLTETTDKEINGKAYINGLQSDLAKLLKPLPADEVCDRCKQEVSQDHIHSYESKRSIDLENVQANLDKYQKLLIKVQGKKNAFSLELNALDLSEKNKTKLEYSLINSKSAFEEANRTVAQLTETIDLRKNELNSLQEIFNSYSITETNLSSKLQEILNNSVKDLIEKISSEINSLSMIVSSLDKEMNSCNINIGVLKNRIEERLSDKEKLETLSIQLKDEERVFSMRQRVQQGFSSSGIPTMIINTILDDLQVQANEVLQSIRPEIQVQFSISKTKDNGQQEDTLDLMYFINGIEHEYEQLSGAQKVMISLSLKMAMSLVIQHRIGVDLKFLGLDEVDASLDEEALDAYINVVKSWQDKFTIFVITHNRMLKDKFSHAILVEGDGTNGSCGKLVTNW